jgi:alpha-1,3-glucan synthase
MNESGIVEKKGITLLRQATVAEKLTPGHLETPNRVQLLTSKFQGFLRSTVTPSVPATVGAENTRTVLIATMEYLIEDWDIKIKIGGLGAMAE